MSQKGPVKYDKDSIVNVVVATRATTSEVRADAERGKKLCTDLLEDESLKGADGEVIREALSSYMDTFTNLSNSCDRVAKIVSWLAISMKRQQKLARKSVLSTSSSCGFYVHSGQCPLCIYF